jgi:hypothetical protein
MQRDARGEVQNFVKWNALEKASKDRAIEDPEKIERGIAFNHGQWFASIMRHRESR